MYFLLDVPEEIMKNVLGVPILPRINVDLRILLDDDILYEN